MNKERVFECNEHDRGAGEQFLRYRRITGYLSMLHQFNDGKRHEEKDRVKHNYKHCKKK